MTDIPLNEYRQFCPKDWHRYILWLPADERFALLEEGDWLFSAEAHTHYPGVVTEVHNSRSVRVVVIEWYKWGESPDSEKMVEHVYSPAQLRGVMLAVMSKE